MDASLILQGRQPQFDNPLDSAIKGLNMRQLLNSNMASEKEMAQKQQMNDIMKKNVVVGPDGNSSLNNQGVVNDMMQVSPMQAIDLKKTFGEHDLAKLKTDAETMGLVAAGATPDNWPSVKAHLVQLGVYNADKLPDQATPEMINGIKNRSLAIKDQAENQLKQADLIKTQSETAKNNAETKKITAETSGPLGVGKLTPGELEFDKKFAEDYQKYTSTGRSNAIATINQLKGIAQELKGDQGFGEAGGGRIGSFGHLADIVRSPDAIRRRDTVQNASATVLKDLFGGRITDKELQVNSQGFYNDQLGNAENYKLLTTKIKQLEQGLIAEDAKAGYFQKNRTLGGYRGPQTDLISEKPDTTPTANDSGSKPSWAK